MRKLVICNAFSINMLIDDSKIIFNKIDIKTAKDLVRENETLSIVGHTDTANVMSSLLGTEIVPNRISWSWNEYDVLLLIGQFTGPRLPEGATTLPEGATITWWLVEKY